MVPTTGAPPVAALPGSLEPPLVLFVGIATGVAASKNCDMAGIYTNAVSKLPDQLMLCCTGDAR